jgi:hypothetical protein
MRSITHIDVGKNSAGVVVVVVVVFVFLFLVAMLYTLTSGYMTGSSSAPKSFSFTSTGFFRNVNVTDMNFSVSSSAGLTTASVGLKILTTSGSAVPVGIASSNTRVGCTQGNPFGGCGVGNGTRGSWYAVITDSSANVEAVYDVNGWIVGGDIGVSYTYTLTIVSATSYIGSGDTLSAYGLGSSSVSGQTVL